VLLHVIDGLGVVARRDGFDDHRSEVCGPVVLHLVVIVIVELDFVFLAPWVEQFALMNTAFGGCSFGGFQLEENDRFAVVSGQLPDDIASFGEPSVFKLVGFHRCGELRDVVAGLRLAAGFHGALHAGETEAGQGDDDGDDDKEFDEREGRRTAAGDE